jgi:hypothetical protein
MSRRIQSISIRNCIPIVCLITFVEHFREDPSCCLCDDAAATIKMTWHPDGDTGQTNDESN